MMFSILLVESFSVEAFSVNKHSASRLMGLLCLLCLHLILRCVYFVDLDFMVYSIVHHLVKKGKCFGSTSRMCFYKCTFKAELQADKKDTNNSYPVSHIFLSLTL